MGTACGSVRVAQGNGNDPKFTRFSWEPAQRVLIYQVAIPSLTRMSLVVTIGSQVRAGQTCHPGARATLCAGRGGAGPGQEPSPPLAAWSWLDFFLHRETRGLREAM